eukprot:8900123-Pyramimonas_sp.AAC.1
MVTLEQDEVGHQLGVPSCVGLIDIDGFYDNVLWEYQVPKGLALGFPAAIPCLVVLQRAAPRSLGQSSSWALPIEPTQSAVQGPRSGTRFGCIMVYYVPDKVCSAHHRMGRWIWVGNLAQHAI